MKQWVVRWIVAGLVLWSLPAWGEDIQNSEDAVSVLETMVVTAGRVEEKKEDVTTNITVITEEEIKQSSAHDLGDLLGERGFLIQGYPNSLVQLDLRGFKTNLYGDDLESYVLILIDGRRAGTTNLAKINLDNVERVEILRGPGSVQYGASAMGGVINVITKKGWGKPSVYVEQTLGSWDFRKTAAGASGQFRDFDFSTSVSTESLGDYSTADGDTYYNTGFDSKERISINAGWTFMPKNRIGVTYTGFESKNVGSMAPLSKSGPDDNDEISKSSNDKVDLVYDGQTANGFLLWKLRYFNGEDKHGDTSRDEQQGGQAQLTVDWKHTRVTTGVDWIHYEYEDDNTYDNPAAFLLAKTKLLDDKLVLSAGGRYDQYEIENNEGRSTDDSHEIYSLGAAYKIIPGLSVRANYAEAFKMPTPYQLLSYVDYSAWGMGIWTGNPDLEPEKSETYEIGIDFTKGSLSSGLTYFHTSFVDQIAYYQPAPDVWSNKNIASSTISGIEGTLEFDLGALFDWTYELAPYASFTHLIEYKNDETGEDLYYNPDWKASFGLRFARRDIGFVSKLNFAYFNEWLITDYQGTGENSLGGYTVADLTISKTLFSLQKYGDVSIKADVRNLFNEDYELMQGYPLPGRTFFVGLKYEY